METGWFRSPFRPMAAFLAQIAQSVNRAAIAVLGEQLPDGLQISIAHAYGSRSRDMHALFRLKTILSRRICLTLIGFA